MRSRITQVLALLISTLFIANTAFAADQPSDSWLTTKAKIALLSTDGIDGTDVHVDTMKGVITLHGKVKSDLMRQRAIEVARVPGAVGVRSLLQVVAKPDEKFVGAVDDAIKDQVSKMLKDDKSLDNSRIKVESVDKGVVILSGTANSDLDLLTAINHARQVPGVRFVSNQIKTPAKATYTVKTTTKRSSSNSMMDTPNGKNGTTNGRFMDAETTTAVKLQLMRAEDVPAMDINVDTFQGNVTLFGIVPTAQAKAAAEAAARRVGGAKTIENSIEVVPESKREYTDARDSDVQKDVKRELGRIASLKKIDVEAKNGVVRLSGTVNDSTDQLTAVTVARSVNGVRAVQNDMKDK